MAVPVYNTDDVPSATEINDWFTNVKYVRKTATESVTSSTTLQDDDQLLLSLSANATYEISGLLITDGATGGDIKILWQGPSGASIALSIVGPSLSAATGADVQSFLYETFSTAASFGTLGAADHRPIRFGGIVRIAATAGTLQLRWAQEASSGTATRILADSYLCARRVD